MGLADLVEEVQEGVALGGEVHLEREFLVDIEVGTQGTVACSHVRSSCGGVARGIALPV